MRYFTSDTHFGHENIIKYCKRPFRDKYEMDCTIIENWNKAVRPTDTVIHCGDVTFYGRDQADKIIKQLNGYKIVIRGNHDKGLQRLKEYGFDEAHDNMQLKLLDGRLVNISHYPYYEHSIKSAYAKPKLLAKNLRNDGRWLLCGHVHDNWKNIDKMVNVGVDVWDFKPVSEYDLVQYIEAKEKK